ncbi:hypothetical protein B0T26DRAFT_671105 [Lasiosphaeria miniovina]|uniref:Uncharacterized protein n=1 Tax=Lasiosphaeria miniovina TaxID=1954250 RepID=A0AA40BIK2_9PEZI|nr:uncharacterized protein B0T26DRAFT_671105 [Lasiosphaeria miniovina]KAK0734877.1 hypothetical protein B0T26DRAFT_671105 [Lasiosphaeria miniovina]
MACMQDRKQKRWLRTVENPESVASHSFRLALISLFAPHLSGFSTYDPTPSPREPSPVPVFDDPWERLEYERRRFCWNEEDYQFERIFLKEGPIDRVRAKHEDQEGDRRREKELEEIEKSDEYERRVRHFNLRAEGWTQEQIDAEDRAAAAKRAARAERELREICRENKPMTERLVHRYEALRVNRERQAELAQKAGRKLELVSEAEEIEAEERKFMESIRYGREKGLPRTGDFNPFYIALGVSKERPVAEESARTPYNSEAYDPGYQHQHLRRSRESIPGRTGPNESLKSLVPVSHKRRTRHAEVGDS